MGSIKGHREVAEARRIAKAAGIFVNNDQDAGIRIWRYVGEEREYLPELYETPGQAWRVAAEMAGRSR